MRPQQHHQYISTQINCAISFLSFFLSLQMQLGQNTYFNSSVQYSCSMAIKDQLHQQPHQLPSIKNKTLKGTKTCSKDKMTKEKIVKLANGNSEVISYIARTSKTKDSPGQATICVPSLIAPNHLANLMEYDYFLFSIPTK